MGESERDTRMQLCVSGAVQGGWTALDLSILGGTKEDTDTVTPERPLRVGMLASHQRMLQELPRSSAVDVGVTPLVRLSWQEVGLAV